MIGYQCPKFIHAAVNLGQGRGITSHIKTMHLITSMCYIQLISVSERGLVTIHIIPNSKVHGANMGLTWGLSVPDGPHVGQMNLVSGIVSRQMAVLASRQPINKHVAFAQMESSESIAYEKRIRCKHRNKCRELYREIKYQIITNHIVTLHQQNLSG